MAAPKGNKNAEKWTEEESISFLEEAIQIAKDKGHDFIGEVATDLDSYRDIFTFLKDKFPECNRLYKRLVQQCESNCFSHGKKGDIVPSLAIVNLKSNHGWTDRVITDNTNTNTNLNSEPLSKEELEEARKKLDEQY